MARKGANIPHDSCLKKRTPAAIPGFDDFADGVGVGCFPLDLNSHDSEKENLHRRSAGVPERSRYSILESDVGGLENGCRPGPLGNDDGSNQTGFHTAAGGVEPLGAVLSPNVLLLQVDLTEIGKGEEKDQYGRNLVSKSNSRIPYVM